MPFGRRKTHTFTKVATFFLAISAQFLVLLPSSLSAQLPASHVSLGDDPVDSPGWYDHELTVQCTEDEMIISVSPRSSGVSFLDNDIYSKEAGFSGSIYPRDLGRATGCMARYRKTPGPVIYRLPLRACNTMPYTLDDGTTEYRNILMVQPHPRLVTGRGKSHEVSCKPPKPNPKFSISGSRVPHAARLTDYKPGDQFDVSTLVADALPSCTMKIYKGDPVKKEVATSVKIGDPLTLEIALDKELGKHGLRITDCIVKDGLGWAQQNLINNEGCPLDNEIMGTFQYSKDGSKATVTFQAHKFPYTAGVYYQCNVKLCNKDNKEECKPICDGSNTRTKRQVDKDDEEEAPATIEVFSGLYVNEATDLPTNTDEVTKEKNPDDAVCISQRNFAIAICIAGLILMLAVVTAILVILARRRGPKSISNTGSSIYSGPYTNTGYSHTS